MNIIHHKKLRKFRLKGSKVHKNKLYFGLKSLEIGRIDNLSHHVTIFN